MRDTGNDLIACKGRCTRSIQVKTRWSRDLLPWQAPERTVDLLALAALVKEGDTLRLDKCALYLVPVDEIEVARGSPEEFRIGHEVVEKCFRACSTCGR